FVLSRAGANAIFEFLALRIPMLLIPLSRAASRGYQIVNAQSFQKQKYARVIQEEDLTKELLMKELMKLKQKGDQMKETMKDFSNDTSRDRIVEIIKEVEKSRALTFLPFSYWTGNFALHVVDHF